MVRTVQKSASFLQKLVCPFIICSSTMAEDSPVFIGLSFYSKAIVAYKSVSGVLCFVFPLVLLYDYSPHDTFIPSDEMSTEFSFWGGRPCYAQILNPAPLDHAPTNISRLIQF